MSWQTMKFYAPPDISPSHIFSSFLFLCILFHLLLFVFHTLVQVHKTQAFLIQSREQVRIPFRPHQLCSLNFLDKLSSYVFSNLVYPP